jgi:subtilisin family serine protease
MPAPRATADAIIEALGLTPADLAGRQLAPVDVAIIDSGIDATHPDLAGRVVAAKRLENGEITHLTELVNNDTYGHGTAVASIIARHAPNARLFDFCVLHPGNRGTSDDLLAGLRLAVHARYRLINMSLAAPAKIATELNALCERAYYQDQVVVAARRNMPVSNQGYPAEFACVLGVDNGELPQPMALRFRPNQMIELEAPGDGILVAAPGGGYTTLSGTSFATPMVTALCVLLLGAFPMLRPADVRTILYAYGLRDGAG